MDSKFPGQIVSMCIIYAVSFKTCMLRAPNGAARGGSLCWLDDLGLAGMGAHVVSGGIFVDML